ncbi:MAG TPA: SpoIID/LytB domain-containing protein, partial [Armatimonadota bacterium]
TRHYDGKPDRPYRGDFEISLRNDGLTVVNSVNLEDYLCGVVSSEMGAGYPPEALKAQAVAARTYAVKHLGRCAAQGFDLDDTPRCQVYGGYLSEDPRTTKAVNDTAGQVLTYDGQLIDAVYSSTCGGFTESAEDAWGKRVPYLVSVNDADADTPVQAPQSEAEWATYCKSAPSLNCLQPKYAKIEAFRWVRLVTRKELEAALPEACRVGTIQNITPVTRGHSGRITALRLVGSERTIEIKTESRIRAAFGARETRSSAFTVDSYRDDAGTPIVFAFWGAGWGHGIGMCQVGAVGLAQHGWTYDKILMHYYQGVAITRQ